MLDIPQIEVNVIAAYITRIKEQFPTETYLSRRYLHILEIRQWQLRRRLRKIPTTLAHRETLLHGHREAERFLLDIDGGDRKDVIAEIEGILQAIAIEFFSEIQQIERQHPEMNTEFSREREGYRQVWNSYVEETRGQNFEPPQTSQPEQENCTLSTKHSGT